MTAILELRKHPGRATARSTSCTASTSWWSPGRCTPCSVRTARGSRPRWACASGQIIPSAGQLLLNGREVNGVSSDALARAGVCLVPEGRGVFPNLTVMENLRMSTYAGREVRRCAGEGVHPVPAA